MKRPRCYHFLQHNSSTMKRFASIGIVGGLGVALLGIIAYLENTSAPDWVYRCQERGSRFVNELRRRERESGVPPDKLAYTYRVHYNFVVHKCFVRTDARTVTRDPLKVTAIRRIWDVDGRVGAPAYATESRSFSGFDGLILYQDSPDRPRHMYGEEWFKFLMTE
jgi:hypothetical protein